MVLKFILRILKWFSIMSAPPPAPAASSYHHQPQTPSSTYSIPVFFVTPEIVTMTEGVGTHTIRKTAYIRAVYYPRGKLELIKAAARHKNIQSAERYYRAAQGQFDMDKAANDSSFTNLSAWILNNKVDCRR